MARRKRIFVHRHQRKGAKTQWCVASGGASFRRIECFRSKGAANRLAKKLRKR